MATGFRPVRGISRRVVNTCFPMSPMPMITVGQPHHARLASPLRTIERSIGTSAKVMTQARRTTSRDLEKSGETKGEAPRERKAREVARVVLRSSSTGFSRMPGYNRAATKLHKVKTTTEKPRPGVSAGTFPVMLLRRDSAIKTAKRIDARSAAAIHSTVPTGRTDTNLDRGLAGRVRGEGAPLAMVLAFSM